ncbi:MAG: tetratricopeptide repeat protein, partial [bacterium]
MRRDREGGRFSLRSGTLWGAGILAAALLVYAATLSSPFVHDDLTLIGENPAVQQSGRILDAFTTDYWAMRVGDEKRDRLYRPLTTLSLALNRALGGNAPEGYRAVNILLHALASLLLFTLARRFGIGERTAGALALVFALHPVHTEAVNAVVGRADLLAAIGVFAGMNYLLRGGLPGGIAPPAEGEAPAQIGLRRRRAPKGEEEESGDRAGRLSPAWGAGLFFALALFSKEIGAALILWAALWWGWRRWVRASASSGEGGAVRPAATLRSAAALAGVLLLYLAARYAALGMWSRAALPSMLDNPLAHAGAGGRIFGALGVLGRQFRLLVWPWPLSIDYSYSQVTADGPGAALWMIAGALAILLWAAAAWRWRASAPEAAFGLFLFLSAYLPVSNLAFPIGTVMAERLFYLPSAGFLLAAVPLARRWTEGRDRRLQAAALLLALFLFSGMSWARNAEWADPLRLWESAARVSPRSARALRLYGQYLARKGKFEAAISPLERATRIYPRYDPAWVDLGIAQMQSRREKEGEASLKEALRLNPDSPEGHLSLGALYNGTGRMEEAIPHLERAVSLN